MVRDMQILSIEADVKESYRRAKQKAQAANNRKK